MLTPFFHDMLSFKTLLLDDSVNELNNVIQTNSESTL